MKVVDSLKILEQLIRRKTKEEDVIEFLNKNLTTGELQEEFVRAYTENIKMKDETISKLRITPEDFEKHFRIIGTRADGSKEFRGRPRTKN